MNLNELYNENKNPFQDVVDKVAAKEKQADAEHTKGLKDIADKFQSAEKKSSEEFSKKLRADEAKDTHCSDKCCGSDVKAEDCNCPPTCKHCDCNAIVSESQLPQQGVAEATEYGIPDSTPGQLPGGAKMMFGEFKKMWPGVILKRPSGGSLAGSVVADVEGWMNNPKSVWEPLEGVAEGAEIVDQDSDLDQQVYTLMVDGDKVSFTYWDYEDNFQNPDIKEIYQQAREQLGKKLSPEQVKAVARAVFKSFEQGVAEEKAGWSIKGSPKPAPKAPAPSWRLNPDGTSTDKNTGITYNRDGSVKAKQGVAEGQFDPINDDDFYEYNVNTNKIVKRISGKHPIARQFSPMQKEWAGRDADHKIVKGMYAKQLKPAVDEKVSDYLPAPLVNKHSIVKGWRKAKGLDEKAPEILSKAVGAVSGAVSGIGGALIGNMFAPLIGSIAGGAAGAIGGYKVGSAITDAIWDDIAKLFGGEKKAIAAGVAHAKAAAAGEKSFEFNGKKYPVTLKPQEVGKAVAELKAVKEAYTMEKAPPGAKAERMVKHVKKNYSKDGKLTPTEKSIAYATAWKAHNAGKV